MQMVDLQEVLAAKAGVVEYNIRDLCRTLRWFLSDVVVSFRAGLKKSVSDAFLIGFVDTKLHADTANNGITLTFLEVLRRKRLGYPLKERKLLS